MIRESETHQLKSQIISTLQVNTNDNERARALLKTQQYHPKIQDNGTIVLKDESALSHPELISGLLAGKGLPPIRLAVEEEDLEHFFFRIVHQNNHSS
jgi:ABC-2 type transport system ATP-binding protein